MAVPFPAAATKRMQGFHPPKFDVPVVPSSRATVAGEMRESSKKAASTNHEAVAAERDAPSEAHVDTSYYDEVIQGMMKRIKDLELEMAQMKVELYKDPVPTRYVLPKRNDKHIPPATLFVADTEEEAAQFVENYEENTLSALYPVIQQIGNTVFAVLTTSHDEKPHIGEKAITWFGDVSSHGGRNEGLYVGGDGFPYTHALSDFYPVLLSEGIPFYNVLCDDRAHPYGELFNVQRASSSVLFSLTQGEALPDLGMGTIAEYLSLIALGHPNVYMCTNGDRSLMHYDTDPHKNDLFFGSSILSLRYTNRDRVKEAYQILTLVADLYTKWANDTKTGAPTRVMNSIYDVSPTKMKDHVQDAHEVDCPQELFRMHKRTLLDPRLAQLGYINLANAVEMCVSVASIDDLKTDVGLLLQELFVGRFANTVAYGSWGSVFKGDAHKIGLIHGNYLRTRLLLNSVKLSDLRPYTAAIARVMCE